MDPRHFTPLAPTDAAVLHRELVALDEVRALSLAYVPDEARGAALAVARLFTEAEHLPARVSEPMMGAIRAQWWREALDDVFGGGRVRGHPLVRALAATMRERPASRSALGAAFDAVPPLLEAGRYDTLDDAVAAAAAFSPDAVLASLVSRSPVDEAAAVRRLGAFRLLARALVAVTAPSAAPIQTVGARFAATADAAPELAAELRRAVLARPSRPPPGAVPALLPYAVARRALKDGAPGPLRTRLILTRTMLTGRL